MRLIGLPVLLLTLLYAPSAFATATQQEADKLRTSLTPVGAERAGNKNGTIPAWTGGFTATSAVPAGATRDDPFANEKPLFSITQANAGKYADRLPEGAKQLLQRYPDYRMDVYPTHRSAALPAQLYENIFRNATQAHASPNGISYGVAGAAGGIPFPIPKSGAEIMWNHLLAYWGPARELHLDTYVASPRGTIEQASGYKEIADFPYYYPGATPTSFNGYYFKTKHIEDAPPSNVGEAYIAWQPIDTARDRFAAWRLVPGEHRMRRAPSLSYDIPDPEASGFQNLDEYYIFFGGLDRYDFKTIGKTEMYVPYNNNRLIRQPARSLMGSKHANSDQLRYELHRVWVVEATLAAGKRHIAPRRRLYIDEDTWMAVYSDSWDEGGKLWKFGQGTMFLLPNEPAVILGSQFVYDFELGGYVFGFALDGAPYKITAPHPASAYSPDVLAAQSAR